MTYLNNSFIFFISKMRVGKVATSFFVSIKSCNQGFPGSSMMKNPPANAGDLDSISDLERSHIPRSN